MYNISFQISLYKYTKDLFATMLCLVIDIHFLHSTLLADHKIK